MYCKIGIMDIFSNRAVLIIIATIAVYLGALIAKRKSSR